MTETTFGGPVLETTVGGILRAAAERAAETPALVEGTADRRSRRRWSYADLMADSERVARALLGSADERGYYRIEGRLKEMIIRGGENIYPREIEQVLYAHPGVADVAVVGVPDDHWGEQVAAFVRPVPGQDVTSGELTAYCRARLAVHKTPRHWVFTDSFPLTASGKVQKFVLREQFVSGA
jgi:acyl-CoA synthetase (AMP-forming)/AMP-acid ligase II